MSKCPPAAEKKKQTQRAALRPCDCGSVPQTETLRELFMSNFDHKIKSPIKLTLLPIINNIFFTFFIISFSGY